MPESSVSLKNAIIEHFFRGNAQAARGATLYLSAHTADPGAKGASELAGSGYARQAFSLDAAAGGATDAAADVVFPENTGGASYTVTHVGVWDAASGGNYQTGGDLNPDKTVPVGSRLRIPANDLDLAGV